MQPSVTPEMASKGIVGICGSGIIGRGLALLFANSGYRVRLYDSVPSQVDGALRTIEKQLTDLQTQKWLRDSEKSVQECLSLIEGVDSLRDCVRDAIHLQENISENLEIKKKFYRELDKLVEPSTIVGSSSSVLPTSVFTSDCKHRANFLNVHPIYPPHLIRLVEIIPAPWTSPEAVTKSKRLMEEIGQAPVIFNKEIFAFGFNRLQILMVNECTRLVKEGYISAADVDTIVTEGLGLRYAWQGPLESFHMTANGFENTLKNYSPVIKAASQTFKPVSVSTSEEVKPIIDDFNERIPLDKIQDRVQWRDERLLQLGKLKQKMKKEEHT